MFVISKTARGVSDKTIENYHQRLHSISKYFDITMPFEELTRTKIGEMIVSMRASRLAHNSVATYVRLMKTFLNWCKSENLSDITITGFKEKEQ
ncbi:MAG: hypothetical protein E7558_07325 [Ruminococcaceae bacterium]|nr:hypothetical protein [Oscillospiraceae bacterium]